MSSAKPYVYRVENPLTGEFYIGYRKANKKAAELDLPEYKTSSGAVKQKFDQFAWKIVAEFDDHNDAYDFEQRLIHENWGNPLLLNKSCFHGKRRFRNIEKTEEHARKIGDAHRGRTLSDEHKLKLSNAKLGKTLSSDHKNKISSGLVGREYSLETKEKLRESNVGKQRSESTKKNISESLKGKPWSEARRAAQAARRASLQAL